MRSLIAIALLGLALGQVVENCQPTDLYIMRHTERFVSGITGAGIIDATLTEQGRRNASELADLLLGRQIPIEVIFVTTTTYEYQVAMPFAQDTGLPIISYEMGNANVPTNFDLRQKLNNLWPCPETVLIVSHGNLLTSVFNTVGFTGDTDFSQEPFNIFNRLYHLHVEDGVDTLETIIFGDQSSSADVAIPCIFPEPRPSHREPPKTMRLQKANIGKNNADGKYPCHPTDIYATRHTERFQTGITGGGIIDATLTEFGRRNASDLRDFLIQSNIPVETIFVTQTAYSYQVAMPFGVATGDPIISYEMGIANSTNINFDLRQKLDNLAVCPETILIVSHSFQLFQVLLTNGYTGDIDFSLPPFNEFNRLYHLRVDDFDVGNAEIDTIIYGEQGFSADIALPCAVIPDRP